MFYVQKIIIPFLARPVNSVLFRLGYKKNNRTWIIYWVVKPVLSAIYLNKNMTSLQIIKFILFQYTTPLFNYSFLRNAKTEENISITGEENLIQNLFLELYLLHAKTNIYCETKLQLVITLFDSLTDELRQDIIIERELKNKFKNIFKPIKKKARKKGYYLSDRKKNRKTPQKIAHKQAKTFNLSIKTSKIYSNMKKKLLQIKNELNHMTFVPIITRLLINKLRIIIKFIEKTPKKETYKPIHKTRYKRKFKKIDQKNLVKIKSKYKTKKSYKKKFKISEQMQKIINRIILKRARVKKNYKRPTLSRKLLANKHVKQEFNQKLNFNQHMERTLIKSYKDILRK